mmetsp:Transcript_63660/g.148432  ORF Transcript_63660/g.148432 Transcript_63660/m.148432 type:complete len:222 (+) Transcript_63660:198-863(+)
MALVAASSATASEASSQGDRLLTSAASDAALPTRPPCKHARSALGAFWGLCTRSPLAGEDLLAAHELATAPSARSAGSASSAPRCPRFAGFFSFLGGLGGSHCDWASCSCSDWRCDSSQARVSAHDIRSTARDSSLLRSCSALLLAMSCSCSQHVRSACSFSSVRSSLTSNAWAPLLSSSRRWLSRTARSCWISSCSWPSRSSRSCWSSSRSWLSRSSCSR